MADVKTPLTEEQKLRRRVGKTLARGQWLARFKEENPKASREETAEAWSKVRKEETKIGMRMLKTLEKSGFAVVEAPAAAKAA